MAQVKLKLRAAREGDLPRLRALWREGFPFGVSDEYFFDNYFVPDHVESSLLLLEDGLVQSMVFFLPTFWYDAPGDRYAPAPCLVGLVTEKKRRHKQYASWLVETACDFMVEKGAGAVWTVLPDDQMELFFSMQGFWSISAAVEDFEVCADVLPKSEGRILRAEPMDYEELRETLLRGESHIVHGELFATLQRDMMERAGGGMFLMNVGGTIVCALAERKDQDTVRLREFLCPPDKRLQALALLSKELPAKRYVAEEEYARNMLRLMGSFKKLEKPKGYLGCGSLL